VPVDTRPSKLQLADRLPRVHAEFDNGIAAGREPGVQIYVSVGGQAVVDDALGDTRPGVPMTRDSLPIWMSAGKPITAILLAKLVADGLIEIQTPVTEVIPDFEADGKQDITLAHVLTHTGGFRNVGSNWSPEPWPTVIERIAAAPVEAGWVVGETAGYHVASGWYVLAEVCRRVLGVEATDAAVSQMYRERLFGPLRMDDCWIGMPRTRFVDYGTRLGLTYDTSKDEHKPLGFPNSEAGFVLPRPGGNARGPTRGLGRFYEQLLIDRGELDGEPFLPEPVARDFTGRRRHGLKDKTFGATLDWGYGFLLQDPAGKRVPYGYGPHASPDTFGHSGNQSSCAFADPARGLVVCWVTNGLPGEIAHQKRQQAVNKAVYEDLGIA
jgi:CubicO group peptidase (beta-lactamase class C family)